MTRKSIPAARRQQIVNWLREEGSLSIRELESRLDVSHMTVHRDLETLSTRGLIRKVRGGAVLNADLPDTEQDHRSCTMCGGRVTRRQEFIIMPKGKEQITACCPHCGIMLVTDIGEVDTALARDFLYGRMINVYQAYYVIAPDIQLCCEPTVLCFASKSDADKFCRGFGGQVMDFSQAHTHLTASHHHVHR